MDHGMELSFIGPIPVRKFFQKFLPTPLSFPKAKRAKLAGFETMPTDGSESQVYEEFITIVNSICTVVKAHDASRDLATEGDAKCIPHITLYHASEPPPGALLPSFQRIELFVDFGCGSTSDPFDGEDSAFRRSSHPITTSLGRMALHSTRLQMYQFRTFVFSVGVFGDVARLFRWDRSGTIVSGPILYREKGNRELAEFFHRFDLADRVERGWDSTVSDATPEETTTFDQAIETFIGEGKNKFLEKLLRSAGDDIKYSRKKVDITHPSGEQESYIVGRSKVTPDYPTGRCTRGFVAMEMGTKKLVFLKDCWRPNVPEIKSESHWYKILQASRNIGAFSHGSDVETVVTRRGATTRGMRRVTKPHLTLTQNYAKKYCNIEAMVGYVHYRTIQSELYLPLHTFRDSRHLTEIMYDVLLAIEDLHERGVLHRDISDGNIMITIDGHGRLIDFEFAQEVNSSDPHQSTCAGTWQFMSTESLSKPGKVHELCDDLESHFFVLLFNAMRFVKRIRPSGFNFTSIFDQRTISDDSGTHRGGAGKAFMYNQGLLVKFSSEQFTSLVRAIFKLFSSLRDYHISKAWGDDPLQATVDAVEKLKDCEEIKKYFTEALENKGWPTDCDKVEDQHPPPRRSASRRMETIVLSHFGPAAESSGEKRKREEDAPHPQQQRKMRHPRRGNPQ